MNRRLLSRAASVAALVLVIVSASAETQRNDTVSPGLRVTVTGEGFGAGPFVSVRDPRTNRLTPAVVAATPVPTDTSLDIFVPAVRKGLYAVEVRTSLTATPFIDNIGLAIVVPELVGLRPNFGVAGDVITATGFHFGANPGKVKVGSKVAQIVEWADDHATFVVPKLRRGQTTIRILSAAGPSVALRGDFTVGPASIAPKALHVRFTAGTISAEIRPRFGNGQKILAFASDGEATPHMGFVASAPADAARSVLLALTIPVVDATTTFPLTVTGPDASLQFSRPNSGELPTVGYAGTGSLDPQDPSHDVTITVQSIVRGVATGSFRGTMRSVGEVAELGDTVFIEGTFRTRLQQR